MTTNYSEIAEKLVKVARAKGYAAAHGEPDEHARADYVTIRRPGERYPFETVYIDADGFTWGDRFEERQYFGEPEGRSTRVLAAIEKTDKGRRDA